MSADQAHHAVLGSILAQPSCADYVLDKLTADDFDPGWMQLVFTAIAETHAAGADPDAPAVLAHLQSTGRIRSNDGGIGPFIAELYEEAPIPAEPARHVAAVIETTYRRQLWSATTRIRQACTEWPLAAVLRTVDQELTSAMQASARLAAPTQTEKSTDAGIPGLADILGKYSESPAA